MKSFISILFFVVGCSVLNARSTSHDSLMAIYNNTTLTNEERLAALHWATFDMTYRSPDSALVMIDKYIDFAAEVNDKDNYLLGLHYKGKHYKQLNEYDKAIACFKLGLKESEKAGNTKRLGHFYINLGTIEEELGDLQEAANFYKKGLAVVVGKKCAEVEARGLMNIGNIEKIWGNYTEALTYFYQALDVCVENSYNGYLPFLKQSMGDIYFSIADYPQALVFYNESLEASKKQSNVNRLIYALTKSGATHLVLNQPQEAKAVVEEAIQLCVKYGLKKNEAIARNVLTKIYLTTHQLKNAKQQNLKAIQLCSEEDKDVLKNSYLIYAQVLVQLGNITAAEKYSQLSLAIALAQNDVEVVSDNYWQLYQIAKQQKRYKAALYYQEQHAVIKSKLANKQNIRQLSLQEAQYNFDKQLYKDSLSYENEKQQQEVDYQLALDKKNSELQIVSIFGIFFLVIAIVVFYGFYNNKKKNLKLAAKRNEIEQKNNTIEAALEEKEVLLQEIHHRVKNNLQIISSLLELQAMNVTDKAVKKSLLSGQARVKTMALLHQKLYQSNNFGTINLRMYFTELIQYLESIYASGNERTVELNFNSILLDIDTAISLGLIVNELISNSFKHAFGGVETPKITLTIVAQKEGTYQLTYEDNGVGFVDGDNKPKTLGMLLIHNLSRQLLGKAVVNNPKTGCNIDVFFTTKSFRKNIA